MEEVAAYLTVMKLELLDQAWVEAIYYAEYLEFGEIPEEYACVLRKINIRRLFRNIMDSVTSWQEVPDEEPSWTLMSRRIPYRKLLAVLGYLIYQGTKHVMNEKHRTNSLVSARLFFRLMSIPGCIAYNIYHSQLFANSLSCIGYPKLICDKFDDQKNKSRDDLDHEDKIVNITNLKEQVNSLIKQLQLFVLDLRAIIEQLQLGPSDMNFEDILNNLVDVTGGAILSKLNVDRIELTNMNLVIYEIIDILVRDANRQPVAEAVKLLWKCLRNKLIAVSLDNKASNTLVQASYVAYCGVVLSKYGKMALINFHIFLEHLCYNQEGLERSEARMSRVKMVSGLMTMLPPQIHNKLVKWIIILSKSIKANHRQLAVELLEHMLTYNNSSEREMDEDSEANGQIEDSGIGADAETEQENAEEFMDQDQLPNLPPRALQIVNVEPEVTEEELQQILHDNLITVSYGEILRAIYDCVADVTGMVRQRAVAIFSKCLQNPTSAMKEALKEISGDGEKSRLMVVGARCVCDERAAVRRAGLVLVHRLLERQDGDPVFIELEILVKLCRDASITVRLSAISALSELTTTRTCTSVIDAVVTGPLRQLSDPENKIQDAIKTLIQEVLINRIRKYTPSDEDPLPWNMLAGITRHNVRQHLLKACAQLSTTTNCINVYLVDCLSTHLGAINDRRDLHALVLLTCVGRYVDYSDIQFAIEYYFRLVEKTKTDVKTDPRLMALTLELLTVWSRFATPDVHGLRDCLIRSVAATSDSGCRINAALLALHLDGSGASWAPELMQLAERAALNGGSVEEWLRAADISLVANINPSKELLELFLNAIKNPPKEWNRRQYATCLVGAGRLCLRTRSVAATLAPPAAALLHSTEALQARINALLVLADICSRYSNIMEPLLESVSRCLSRSAPAALRRHAARALTRLLLAGFLRLRPPLFYSYCALLADEDHEVREPAEYYITCCLTSDAIFHHFVDCVRYFNTNKILRLIFDARQLLYDVMLQRLSLVQRLNMQCRLAREIIEYAADLVDEGIELDESTNNMLLDAITILCGPRMKLPVSKKQSAAPTDVTDMQEVIHERITTTIVSQKMKHTVAEVLVPAALRLHAGLRARGGQLVAYLVRLINDLISEYRAEIEDIIQTDEELVEQITQFQQTIGLEPMNGNARNLVTSSAPPEPETPRAPRRRAPVPRDPECPRKRALRI